MTVSDNPSEGEAEETATDVNPGVPWQAPRPSCLQPYPDARALYGSPPSEQKTRTVVTAQPELEKAEVEPEPVRPELPEAPQEPSPEFDEAAFDSDVLGTYRETAANLGIETDTAQRLLERVAPRIAERQAEQLSALRQQWVEQARSDPEISGGTGFDENLTRAQAVLMEFGSAELGRLLESSGLGDNPALVKLLLKVDHKLRRMAQDPEL